MSKVLNRRGFLKKSSQIAGLTILLGSAGTSAFAQRRRRGGGDEASEEMKLADPNQGMAKSVNYVHNQSQVTNESLKVEKQGVPFKDQFCHNCILYKKTGEKDGKEVGTCTLFPNQLVMGEGWCSSWAKKG